MFSNDPEVCVNTNDLPAGHPRLRHRSYAEELRRRTDQTSRLAVFVSVSNDVNASPQHEKNGLSIIPVPSRHRIFSPFAHVLPTLRAVRHFRPNLITAQSPWESGPIAIIAGWLSGAAVQLQLHGDIASKEWNACSFSYRLRSHIARLACSMADSIRVVSNSMKSRLSSYWNIPEERFCVVPVPVKLPEECTMTPEQAKEKLQPGLGLHQTVLFVGRLYAPKNMKLWAETAAIISSQKPDVRFIIAGDGDERENLVTFLKKHNLEAKTILTGYVTRDKLPSIYKTGNVFMLTSSHEAFGMVIVESLLSEVPVVSTATGGPSEIIIDGITGRLITINDSKGLSQAVIEILDDSEKAREMGRTGAQQMRERFSPENITELLVKSWLNWATGRKFTPCKHR